MTLHYYFFCHFCASKFFAKDESPSRTTLTPRSLRLHSCSPVDAHMIFKKKIFPLGTATHLFLKTFRSVPTFLVFFWIPLPSSYDCARLLKRYSGIHAAGCTVRIHNKCISRGNTPIDFDHTKGNGCVLLYEENGVGVNACNMEKYTALFFCISTF